MSICTLTIKVLLILKVRDIIFLAGKTHNGPFQGFFPWGQDFFDLFLDCHERSNGQFGDQKRNGPLCVLPKTKK
jgi:hypothetical protein